MIFKIDSDISVGCVDCFEYIFVCFCLYLCNLYDYVWVVYFDIGYVCYDVFD